MLHATQNNGSMRSNSRRGGAKQKLDGNRLFPVFVKLESLRVVIVGGGNVAEEKLKAILGNAPESSIRIISKSFTPGLRKLADRPTISLLTKAFDEKDLNEADIVFSA